MFATTHVRRVRHDAVRRIHLLTVRSMNGFRKSLLRCVSLIPEQSLRGMSAFGTTRNDGAPVGSTYADDGTTLLS